MVGFIPNVFRSLFAPTEMMSNSNFRRKIA